ncbi:hypothetical protein ET475_14065 [Microbacterium protaetiae]|uniref:PH domain-containing protein n=1 Tax=Microbacterium protaetiae TaxID=2509458 RepID=A0A4P6EF63_9MICO|nr:hypothetical protein [Microbacterium protaetiae]QAY61002.1 hypothetical protein ET475_14065 [Microbacterium protaetiae]
MMKDLDAGGAVVLRATSSLVAFIALAGAGALFVGDALLRGRWELGLRVAGVFLFVLWAAWVFLVRMSIRFDRAGVSARNLLRVIDVPWGRIVSIERHAQLRLVLDDGGAVECWGSPFAPRAGRHRGAEVSDTALELLRTAWQSSSATGGDVRRGWDLPAIIAGAILLLGATAALVF